ncbi:PhzF family phenazine biosynthesis protein [Mongoliitalea daihaiensis]|uniref:PhzF family phenazine biosynthesis protein n=1 Tax=Mongoliitalea daihaiensis TaxID=2782006 RepID=UPI001F1F701F|nr:PhzF family phenazine biosynthesis isomerase [Mongoliitalea daihaiensis]
MKIYQIDAFTDQVFGGNPAAVVPLQAWLPDEILQSIALENNLSETAFYVPKGNAFELRWFTPTTEVALCGHATLAAAHVLFEEEGYRQESIEFESRSSGMLRVTRTEKGITLDFPVDELTEIDLQPNLLQPFHTKPIQAFQGKTDIILVFESADHIKKLGVDMSAIAAIEARGVIVTAPGDDVDFVSRFFGPRVGVPEDPVTGSAHTSLTPLWNLKTQKTSFQALQLSPRGGKLHCQLKGDRVLITGNAVTYMKGIVMVNSEQ